MSRKGVDVAVVGGGPAGSVCAQLLAASGASVALCQSGARRSTVELLSGRARWLLRGVVLPAGVEIFETVSHWDSGGPLNRSSIFDPYGPALAVEREELDAALRSHAITAGATLVESRIRSVCREGDGWAVGDHVVADRIVLATGGAANPEVGRQEQIVCRQRTQFARFCGPVAQHLCIERTDSGWWYGLPSPDGGFFVGLCSPGASSFQADLAKTLLIATQAKVPVGSRWGMAASVRHYDRVAGQGWIAVGNSAFSPDPLCGEGIWFALHTARAATDALLGRSSFDDYQAMIDRAVRDHLESREAMLAGP